MSETTPGETPVERLDVDVPPMPASNAGIRIKFHKGGGYTLWDKRKGPRRLMALVPEDEAQIGREALALLREFDEADWNEWIDKRRALLARCEGDR